MIRFDIPNYILETLPTVSTAIFLTSWVNFVKFNQGFEHDLFIQLLTLVSLAYPEIEHAPKSVCYLIIK